MAGLNMDSGGGFGALLGYEVGGVKIEFSLKREYRDCTVTFSPFVSPAESDTSDLAADVIADCRTGIVPDWQSTPLIFSDSCNRIYAGTERIIRFSGSFFGEVPTLERWTGCAVYDMRRKETAWEDRKVEGNREDRSHGPLRVTLYVNPGIEEGRKTDGQAKLTDSRLFDALGLDYIMSHNHRVILHSSFISWQGGGILFTAPSGTGKSTQADLWKRHEEGVTIINGDRSILGFKEGRAWVYGLPFCGTSGIAENMDCPLRAVVVLRQGRENQIRRLGQREAFSLLLSECTVNTWDTEGTENIMDLLIRIVRTVPVYYFACLPDFSAVEMLKAALADDYRKG